MKTQLKYFLIEIFINFTKIRSEFLNILFKFKQNLNNYNNYKIEINKLINRIVDESCIVSYTFKPDINTQFIKIDAILIRNNYEEDESTLVTERAIRYS